MNINPRWKYQEKYMINSYPRQEEDMTTTNKEETTMTQPWK